MRGNWDVRWPSTVTEPNGQKHIMTEPPEVFEDQLWSLMVSMGEPQFTEGEPGGPQNSYQVEAHNPYEHSIFVRGIYIWNGVSKNSTVDFWSRVWAAGGIYEVPIVPYSHNWDRYAPTSFHPTFDRPLPGYLEIAPAAQGGHIAFNATCNVIEPQEPAGFSAQLCVLFTAIRPGHTQRAILSELRRLNAGANPPTDPGLSSVQLVIDGRAIGLQTTP